MDFGMNETDFVRQLSRDVEKKDPSQQPAAKTEFPVVAVAVSTCLVALLLVVFVGLYFIHRRRKQERYKHYTPVTKEAIRPELNVDASARKQEQRLGLDTLKLPNMVSSDDSIAPSSDDTYYDALDRQSDEESISSREPSSIRKPEGYIGKLSFGVVYDYNSESLTVVLRNAADLPDRSSTVQTCDPSVKISLLPGNKHVAQSRYKRKNKNPIFNETFEVSIPSYEIGHITLCLTVLDGYRANQQILIGHVIYPLNQLENSVLTEVESELTKPTEITSDFGQLHVSLSYYPILHRLAAIVLRATNLPKLSHRQPDSFVKVSFSIGNKIMKTKKTAIHQDTTSPMYNEDFNFTVSEDDLGTSTLLISVMHSGGGFVEDKLIGRILVGGRMYARGTACDHWVDMMASPRKMIKCWHELTQ